MQSIIYLCAVYTEAFPRLRKSENKQVITIRNDVKSVQSAKRESRYRAFILGLSNIQYSSIDPRGGDQRQEARTSNLARQQAGTGARNGTIGKSKDGGGMLDRRSSDKRITKRESA